MSDLVKAEGIRRIRELADALERDQEGLALIIAWCSDGSGMKSMDFGHPIICDALVMHCLRVRVQHGTVPITETEQ